METTNEYMGVWYMDFFWPESAVEVLKHIAEYDEETLALVIMCEAYCAEAELSRN